jgi:hypothetical protein
MDPYVLNKEFCPTKLVVKISEFKDKKYPKSRAYLGQFGAIFLKKIAPCLATLNILGTAWFYFFKVIRPEDFFVVGLKLNFFSLLPTGVYFSQLFSPIPKQSFL